MIWAFDPRARRSRRRLKTFQDKHVGELCFIIGNGPSLRRMDLRPLAEAFTFGLNRGYLLRERIGAPFTYHVVINRLVVEQWADEITSLPSVKFLPWGRRHWFDRRSDIVFIGGPRDPTQPLFSTDPSKTVWSGATVTYVAMQLAFYMGFSRVILIGVDHTFKARGQPHQEVTSSGDDLDHFDPNYFGKGARWQLPDLETSELAYMLARYHYTRAGREVLDATLDGALHVFPKVSYESLFD